MEEDPSSRRLAVISASAILLPAPPSVEHAHVDAAGSFGCRRERRVQGLHELDQIRGRAAGA
jgi:hypothetical protein